jgi:3-hydroxyisobutyrate dehydrogenase
MTSASHEKVAFLGMGIMGAGMAANLAKAGFKVNVWNRTANNAGIEQATKAGCTKFATIAEAIKDCQLIFSCVSDVKDVEEVLTGPHGVLRAANAGAIVIDTSTIGPEAAKKIGSLLAEKQIQFMDAPVSGGDIGAQNGTLTFMVGGSQSNFEMAQVAFKAMGKTIQLCGPIGAGQALKLCNQILCAVNMLAVTESILLAQKFELDPKLIPEVLGTGAGGSWALANLGPRINNADFAPAFMLKHMLKDLRLVHEEIETSNLSLPGMQLATIMFEQAADNSSDTNGTQAMILGYKN